MRRSQGHNVATMLDASMDVELNGVTMPDKTIKPWGEVVTIISDKSILFARHTALERISSFERMLA